jgi:hypothetical protein
MYAGGEKKVKNIRKEEKQLHQDTFLLSRILSTNYYYHPRSKDDDESAGHVDKRMCLLKTLRLFLDPFDCVH